MIIIAEAGINHNGKYSLAQKLAEKAKRAGADAIKFQVGYGDKIYSNVDDSVCFPNLTWEEYEKLKEYCDWLGITFLATPHTLGAIDFLDDLVPFHKIASPHMMNSTFIKKVAEKNKPILMSTGSIKNGSGMATKKEISNALMEIPDAYVILLHCVSKYPCLDMRLDRFYDLRKWIENDINYSIGISDHTQNIYMNLPQIPVLEKHIMLEGVDCPDKAVSLNGKQFNRMIDFVRFGKWY